jgi:hypothetical protein
MLRRRPILRTVGRTAVIAGTATVVAGGVARHQANKYGTPQAAPAAPVAEAAPMALAAESTEDPIEELAKLGALKEQGILTDEEFAQAKAKILALM